MEGKSNVLCQMAAGSMHRQLCVLAPAMVATCKSMRDSVSRRQLLEGSVRSRGVRTTMYSCIAHGSEDVLRELLLSVRDSQPFLLAEARAVLDASGASDVLQQELNDVPKYFKICFGDFRPCAASVASAVPIVSLKEFSTRALVQLVRWHRPRDDDDDFDFPQETDTQRLYHACKTERGDLDEAVLAAAIATSARTDLLRCLVYDCGWWDMTSLYRYRSTSAACMACLRQWYNPEDDPTKYFHPNTLDHQCVLRMSSMRS